MDENHNKPNTISTKEARTEVYFARWLWRGLRKVWGDMTYLNERMLLPSDPTEHKDSLAWRGAMGGRMLVEKSNADPMTDNQQRHTKGRAA